MQTNAQQVKLDFGPGLDRRIERQVLVLSIPLAPRSRKTRTDGALF